MSKYIRRPEVIEAVRWDDHASMDEVLNLLGNRAKAEKTTTGQLLLIFPVHHGEHWQIVHLGDFITRDHDAKIAVVKAEAFEKYHHSLPEAVANADEEDFQDWLDRKRKDYRG